MPVQGVRIERERECGGGRALLPGVRARKKRERLIGEGWGGWWRYKDYYLYRPVSASSVCVFLILVRPVCGHVCRLHSGSVRRVL